MTADLVLNNAKANLRQGIVDCSIAVEEGRILKIGKETHMPRAEEKTDLHNLLVLPGMIDTHVHLRDEAKANKETILTGTASAAACGFTTVLDMPNNAPVTMSVETLLNRQRIAERTALVNVGFYSEFPFTIEEIQAILREGAVGFKLFMAEQVGGVNVDEPEALKAAFAKTSELDAPVAVHAEDHMLLKRAAEALKLNNRHDIAAFLKAHDPSVELEAIRRVLTLTEGTERARIHFCHVSTSEGLAQAAEAKKAGRAVTVEVTPHHLLLTKEDLERLGPMALTMPPLRTREHIEALWKGIAEGAVDTIGSDHAPHTAEEKDAASIWEVKSGVPGLETTLPLMLTAVHKRRLNLDRMIQLLAEKPAEVFHLKDRAILEQGRRADLAVVDFNAKFRIDVSKFQSKAKFSPFDGWEAQGKPVKTYVGGVLVMDEGEIVAKPGVGGVLRREQA